MKCKMNLEERRALLDSFKGKIFSVEFVKKDNSVRKATCKHFVHKAFAEGHASLARENTVADKPEYFTAVELTKEEKWININMGTLIKIKCGEVEIEFEK